MSEAADRPRIGLIGDRRVASFGAWSDVDLGFVWSHYIEAVTRAGGAPVIFPVVELYADSPALALDSIDGLVLTGGRDIDARSYGAEPDPHNEPGDPLRDRVETEVAGEALRRELPILGVCRGMQLLNLVLGGSIDQHLADPERIHRDEPGSFVEHEIEVEPQSRLASILGERPEPVRSHHHQGLGELADQFVVSARSPDGLVEAAEAPDRDFCLAVLWHPEENLEAGGLRLYEALVDAARERSRTKVAA